jgi:hypothetical protein
MNNIIVDDFFSQSKPNLVNTLTLQEIDGLLNKNDHMIQQNNLWNDNFYENHIEPNLLFFFAMIILCIFLYYKYIMKLEETEEDKINRKKYENKYKKQYEEKIQLLNKILEDDLENIAEKQKQEEENQKQEEINNTTERPQYNHLMQQNTHFNDYTFNTFMPENNLNSTWYSDFASQPSFNQSNDAMYGYY